MDMTTSPAPQAGDDDQAQTVAPATNGDDLVDADGTETSVAPTEPAETTPATTETMPVEPVVAPDLTPTPATSTDDEMSAPVVPNVGGDAKIADQTAPDTAEEMPDASEKPDIAPAAPVIPEASASVDNSATVPPANPDTF